MRPDVMNYDVISHISQIETRDFAEKGEKTMETCIAHHSQERNPSFYRKLYQPRTFPLKLAEKIALANEGQQ